MLSLLSQSQTPTSDPAAAVGVIIFMLVALVIGLAIGALIVYFCLYKPYTKVPAEHQTMSPGLVFLMLVPFVNLVWVFFVGLQVPDAFKSYFDSVGDSSVGDAGRNLGLWWAICSVAGIIPFVNFVAGPAALVLFIIFVVKLWNMAGRIDQTQTTAVRA